MNVFWRAFFARQNNYVFIKNPRLHSTSGPRDEMLGDFPNVSSPDATVQVDLTPTPLHCHESSVAVLYHGTSSPHGYATNNWFNASASLGKCDGNERQKICYGCFYEVTESYRFWQELLKLYRCRQEQSKFMWCCQFIPLLPILVVGLFFCASFPETSSVQKHKN